MYISEKICYYISINFFFFLAILSTTVSAQTPPNNLTLDEENHLMKLEGLNTSSFYDEETLESVYLNFNQSDYWQKLKDSYDTENYVLGTLTYRGEIMDSIGAQFKGNTSYKNVTNDAKYSFAIELDAFIDGQDIEGYNTLNLNNAFQDPSFMKEVLYNHLNRYNIPGAKSNFVKLYINGEYWGIYANVQQLNKDFTKEWFMTNNGSLWRANTSSAGDTTISPTEGGGRPGGGRPGGGGGGGGAQWGDGTSALNYLGADTALYQKYYTLKHSSQNKPWDLLLNLTNVLNNTPDASLVDSISKYLDIDKTLWFLAHETVFTDDDSYIMKGKQDYYVYYEPETGLFSPMEFDGNSALDTKNIEWDLFYNAEKENYPLMNRLYAIPEIRQRYLAHARSIIDELLDVNLTDSLIEHYDALISDGVKTDPKNMYTFNAYTSEMEELKAYFSKRKEILLTNPEVTQVGLTISSVAHLVDEVVLASPAAYEPVTITATISGEKGVDKIYMYYSSYYVGRFTKIEMMDDGSHNDGLAGDGIYGAQIPGFANGEYVRYYVEAIADDAAKTASFSPVGAEHDVYYFRVGVPETVHSDVVINEISASNKTIMADNEGEFEDWIELYNNSNEAISLAGYALSDDLLERNKWVFPNLSIEANSYLIIWADNDEKQGENHANFKISARGEELFLSNSYEETIDQISFETQKTDITFGRIPNGTGPFEAMVPTFNSENGLSDGVKTGVVNSEALHLRLYPNPANNDVTVEILGDEWVLFSLYSLQGNLVMQSQVYNTTNIDLSAIKKGPYIAQVEGKSSKYMTKLIIK